MAVVFLESFDNFAAKDMGVDFWTGYVPGFTRMDTGRFGTGQCIVVQHLATISRNWGGYASEPANSLDQFIVGAAIKLSGLTTNFMSLLQQFATPPEQIKVGIKDGLLCVTDAFPTDFLGTTLIADDSWFYIELKVDVLAGTFELHLNGDVEIASTPATLGSDSFYGFKFTHAGFGEGATTRIDDVYVLDTSTGSPPQTDFLGDPGITTLRPAADGTYTDWIPLVGTDHYAMVDETLMDGDGSYNSSATPSDKDSYTLDPFPAGSTIMGVQLNVVARTGFSVGSHSIEAFVRQAGTDYGLGVMPISGVWGNNRLMMSQDPTGSDWTPSTVNGDEYGMVTVT